MMVGSLLMMLKDGKNHCQIYLAFYSLSSSVHTSSDIENLHIQLFTKIGVPHDLDSWFSVPVNNKSKVWHSTKIYNHGTYKESSMLLIKIKVLILSYS